MSLLKIIAGAAGDEDDEGAAVLCGLTAPSQIIGSTDPNVPLLLKLANQEGRELARRHDWQALKVDYTVASIAAEAQTALPADYERIPPDAELWNRTLGMRYSGPTDDNAWGRIKGLGLTRATPGYWRLIGNALQITPAPTAGQTLAIPYISRNWVAPAVGAVMKRAFTVDTDTARVPERLITLGIVWRWRKSKGFDYAEDMATYEREVERACSRDRGLKPLLVSGGSSNSSSTTWPGTITT